ncbi:Isotrichodermin C-15 hydroxylase [Trichoderma lentiforme]|uniref:Isotrichodermin C-15 hydroxylase n=1 Tax=Trichoderma lentiforme TaxID=1567552 RepID=A0A9P5CB17_9HYPO|nr:Isotrichodermin C-15 hydroxylase [Trichoderma lentiforme]
MQYASIAAAVAAAVVAYLISTFIYNIAFHPLRSYPGPLLWRATGLFKCYHFLKGDMPFVVRELHVRYGSVVRIAPGELAFSDTQAFKDIYVHKMVKWKGMYGFKPEHVQDLANVTDPAHHAFLRRHMAAGFSETALRNQESILVQHVDLLVNQLRERGGGGKVPQDMRDWFMWLTFDITGMLSFGAEFGGLRYAKSAEWVATLTDNVRVLMAMSALFGYVGATTRSILTYIFMSGLIPSVAAHTQRTKDMLRERMDRKGAYDDRDYIIDGLININDHRVESNAVMLIMAGSETTSTALTATLFALLQAPEKMARLTKEVRSTFSRDEDITMASTLDKLPYLMACINESLRWYPPSVSGLARVVPNGGAKISGHYVPEGTIVAAWTWSVTRDPRYFADAYGFHPERWLPGEDERFANDELDASPPFSVGPRSCMGKNLAMAEMRLTLARMIYNFDVTLSTPFDGDWFKGQKAYLVWDKPSVLVNCTPVGES